MIARRTLLKGASFVAMSAAVSGISVRSSEAQQVPYSSGTEAPKLQAPANACDCHMHIYDSRFPVAANATLRPSDTLVPDYKLLQKRIGTTRNVVVTPSTYGTDNSVTLDAMAKIGPTARGVAVVDTGVTGAELKRLSGLGVRGIRFNLVQAGATTVEMLEPLRSGSTTSVGMCSSTSDLTCSCSLRFCCCALHHRSCSITWHTFPATTALSTRLSRPCASSSTRGTPG